MDYNSEDSYDNIPLEPMILINDGEQENDDGVTETDEKSNSALTESNGPDISIIPIKRKKPLFKIKLFDRKPGIKRKNSYSDDEISFNEQSSVRRRSRDVRIVSKEEAAEHASEPYQKRKSLPLEKCPICKKFFRRMATHLLKHEYVDPNAEDNGLVCNFCNKAFNTQSNLLIHLRTHTGLRPYVCEICSKGFSQSCNLVNHMRIHSGERPYKCPHCDKAFTQSGNLNNHIRLHTNEKPFKCHFCDKAFVQSGNLNSHIKNNHRFGARVVVPDTEPSLSESILNHTI
ncbi:zinc finger protein 271-like [Coccinella septempunctata]|uniref:zinc finger protein 271-like n=1 Tax=Coccinella septempunctata TaxID=41139 RepID=UPI001D07CC93|nr:zinc finger protein 271-like [Coccinella septempunctata]